MAHCGRQRHITSDRLPGSGTPRRPRPRWDEARNRPAGNMRRTTEQATGPERCALWPNLCSAGLRSTASLANYHAVEAGYEKKICTFSLWAHNSSSIAVVYLDFAFLIYCDVLLDVLHSTWKRGGGISASCTASRRRLAFCWGACIYKELAFGFCACCLLMRSLGFISGSCYATDIISGKYM